MQVTLGLHRAAAIRGGAIAVLDGPVRHTWRDLRDRVARLAGSLQRLGVGRGDRVAILMLNGYRHLEIYYAVPWAGALVMPLNIRLTAADLGDQLRDGEPTLRLRSAGVPCPNTELRIVDPEGRLLPPGQVGEIVGRGPQVMKGYWRRPDETAAAIRDGGRCDRPLPRTDRRLQAAARHHVRVRGAAEDRGGQDPQARAQRAVLGRPGSPDPLAAARGQRRTRGPLTGILRGLRFFVRLV